MAARAVDLLTVVFGQLTIMLLAGPPGARLLFAGLLTVYELVFTSRLGQTPGKDLLHVKVAVRSTSASPGLGRAVRRWAVVGAAAALDLRLGALALLLSFAGVLDRLAGTWVIAYDADVEDPADEVDLTELDRLRRRRRLFPDVD